MGLDMYLRKKTYVKNWEHTPKEQKWDIKIKQGGKPFEGIKPNRISFIQEEVLYWRKANHIHKWFVDNVQDGNDNCGAYYVNETTLEELADVCDKVIKSLESSKKGTVSVRTGWRGEEGIYKDIEVFEDTEVAEELLPTAQGFFFGGDKYDEWYLRETIKTRDKLRELLEENKKYDGVFEYSSSW